MHAKTPFRKPNVKQKAVSILLSLSMILSMFPVAAFAADDGISGGSVVLSGGSSLSFAQDTSGNWRVKVPKDTVETINTIEVFTDSEIEIAEDAAATVGGEPFGTIGDSFWSSGQAFTISPTGDGTIPDGGLVIEVSGISTSGGAGLAPVLYIDRMDTSDAEAYVVSDSGTAYYDTLANALSNVEPDLEASASEQTIYINRADVTFPAGVLIPGGRTIVVPDGKSLTVGSDASALTTTTGSIKVEVGGTLSIPVGGSATELVGTGDDSILSIDRGDVTLTFCEDDPAELYINGNVTVNLGKTLQTTLFSGTNGRALNLLLTTSGYLTLSGSVSLSGESIMVNSGAVSGDGGISLQNSAIVLSTSSDIFDKLSASDGGSVTEIDLSERVYKDEPYTYGWHTGLYKDAFVVTFDAGDYGTVLHKTMFTPRGGGSLSEFAACEADEDHTFVGWCLEGTDQVIDESYYFTSNTTLTAKYAYTPRVEVTFDPGAGTMPSGVSNPLVTKTGYPIGSLPEPTPPDGYAFLQWVDEGSSIVTGATQVNASMTITAQYTFVGYTISLFLQEGTLDTISVTTSQDGTITSLPTPTPPEDSPDSIFLGWFIVEGGSETLVEANKTVFSQSTTIVGQWSAPVSDEDIIVTFDAGENGYTDTPQLAVNDEGKLETVPVVVPGDGWKFEGWFTQRDAGDPLDIETDVFEENGIYYAQYTWVGYSIVFEPGGGEVSPQSAKTGDGNKLADGLPTPVNGTKEFLGWYLSDAYEGDALTDDHVFTGSCSVYAKWSDEGAAAGEAYLTIAGLSGKTLYTHIPHEFTLTLTGGSDSAGTAAAGSYVFSGSDSISALELWSEDDGEWQDISDDIAAGINGVLGSVMPEDGVSVEVKLRVTFEQAVGSADVTVAMSSADSPDTSLCDTRANFTVTDSEAYIDGSGNDRTYYGTLAAALEFAGTNPGAAVTLNTDITLTDTDVSVPEQTTLTIPTGLTLTVNGSFTALGVVEVNGTFIAAKSDSGSTAAMTGGLSIGSEGAASLTDVTLSGSVGVAGALAADNVQFSGGISIIGSGKIYSQQDISAAFTNESAALSEDALTFRDVSYSYGWEYAGDPTVMTTIGSVTVTYADGSTETAVLLDGLWIITPTVGQVMTKIAVSTVRDVTLSDSGAPAFVVTIGSTDPSIGDSANFLGLITSPDSRSLLWEGEHLIEVVATRKAVSVQNVLAAGFEISGQFLVIDEQPDPIASQMTGFSYKLNGEDKTAAVTEGAASIVVEVGDSISDMVVTMDKDVATADPSGADLLVNDVSGGLVSTDDSRWNTALTLTLNENTFTDAGGLTVTFQAGDVQDRSGNDAVFTLTITVTPLSYDITFDPNGGAVDPASGITDERGVLVDGLPENVTPPAGYLFKGWSLNRSGGEMLSDASPFAGDTVIYAQYVKMHTITFVPGSGGTMSDTTAYTNLDGKLDHLPTPTEVQDYHFTGWFTQETGGTQVDADHIYADDTTLWAVYSHQPTYVITLDVGGYGTLPEGAASAMRTSPDGTLANGLPTPTPAARYTFNGWFDAQEGGSRVEDGHVFDSAVTLYAQYSKIPWTITFDAGDHGTPVYATMQTDADDALASLPAPTLTDPSGPWHFDGWHTHPTDASPVSAGHVFDSDLTLYAHYTYDSGILVTFVPGEHGTLSYTELPVGETNTLALVPTPSVSGGYRFLYWTEDIDGAGDPLSIKTEIFSSMTVYAQYQYIGNASSLEKAEAWQETFASAVANNGMTWDALITAMYWYGEAEIYVENLLEGDEREEAESRFASLTTYYTTQVYYLDLSDENTSKYEISTGALSLFASLRSLNLRNTGISDSGGLAALTNLISLDLSENPGITESNFGGLAPLSNLQALDLSGTSVSDIGGLTGCSFADTLTALDISDTNVTMLQSIWDAGASAPAFPALTEFTADGLVLSSISGLHEIARAADNMDGVLWDLDGSSLTDVTLGDQHIAEIQAVFGISDRAEFRAPLSPNVTVVFDANGGEGDMPDQKIPRGSSANLTANGFTRVGSVFTGWNTSPVGDGTPYANEALYDLDEDLTLYAQWTANSYTVQFNGNGGDGDMPDQPFVYGVDAPLSENAFTYEGHTFTGWSDARDGDVVYEDGEIVKNLTDDVDGLVTLYAQWAAVKPAITAMTITFADGSTETVSKGKDGSWSTWMLTGSVVASVEVTLDTPVSLSSDAAVMVQVDDASPVIYGAITSADGKTFTITPIGGSGEAGAPAAVQFTASGVTYGKDNTPLADVLFTLTVSDTPIIPPPYTITFDPNGGLVDPETADTDDEGHLSELPIPTCEGFDFDGWFTAPEAGDKVDATHIFTSDATLYAQWTQRTGPIAITLDPNGGSVSLSVVYADEEGALMSALPTPSWDGYYFSGWYTAKEGGARVDASTSFNADATIYAQWTVSPIYVITFNPNGGSSSVTSAVTNEDGKLTSLPTATRSSYSFLGWYTAASGGTKISTSTVFDASITVYARWSYNSGGGSGSSGGGGSGSSGGGSYYVPSYSVSLDKDISGGSVTISAQYAPFNAAVKITVKADDGYILDSLTVTALSTGNAVELTDNGDGTYTFKMPVGNVSVKATFAEDTADRAAILSRFADIAPGAWYEDALVYVVSNGLMDGTGATIFSPNASFTRAMLAQVLYNRAGRPAIDRVQSFDDVPLDAWYSDAIIWAKTIGLVDGYGNGRFGPSDSLSREQLAVMLYRYSQYLGLDTSARSSMSDYTDTSETSSWAEDQLKWAVATGVMTGFGNGLIGPQTTATRAQVAQMLMNYLTGI